MREEIEDKLMLALGCDTEQFDEYRVVYILSRIRKILEGSKTMKKKFKYLKLYCDWVLHCQIDDTSFLADRGIFQNRELPKEELLFMTHIQLIEELNNFTQEVLGNMYVTSQKRIDKFNSIIDEIISETPLVFTRKEKFQTVMKKEGGVRHWETTVIENPNN